MAGLLLAGASAAHGRAHGTATVEESVRPGRRRAHHRLPPPHGGARRRTARPPAASARRAAAAKGPHQSRRQAHRLLEVRRWASAAEGQQQPERDRAACAARPEVITKLQDARIQSAAASIAEIRHSDGDVAAAASSCVEQQRAERLRLLQTSSPALGRLEKRRWPWPTSSAAPAGGSAATSSISATSASVSLSASSDRKPLHQKQQGGVAIAAVWPIRSPSSVNCCASPSRPAISARTPSTSAHSYRPVLRRGERRSGRIAARATPVGDESATCAS